MWFSYRDHTALLLRNQRDQATAAAEKIEQFIEEVRTELGWMTQVPWSAETADEQYLDALRLLRQVPAISEFVQIDGAGREQLRVSRLVMDVMSSGLDLSQDAKFIEANARKAYYGPIYFRRGSEPHMSLALAGMLPNSGVSVAEVNLKFIWDVVSKIKIGELGQAYVIDAEGRLIAHPDINLVLRHMSLSHLPQFQKARADNSSSERVLVTTDMQGRGVLTAYAPIPSLGWLVFADLPLSEAYGPLYASILRSGALLLAGLIAALLFSLFLARRMVIPIQVLSEGATRIGGGDFNQRVQISTGDELEVLGEQFNRMAAHLQDSYANLERRVEERTHQLESANLAKSRFIAAASHDLRQPLQALGLFVAQLRGGKAADWKRTIQRIDAAVTEMNGLFDALLDMSKLDAGVVVPTLTEFPITDLLTRIEATFAEAACAKGLDLRVITSRAWVRSDFILLERILLNLVSNAVRHTQRGGAIVGCRVRDDALRIEVRDTGPGIPEEQRQAIFGEFFQLATPERGAGIGLGLAIVDRLCKLLGHPLELTSVIGKGSRFTIVMPTTAARTIRAGARVPGANRDVGAGKTVVIDDAPLVLEGLGELLSGWGFRVVSASKVDEALTALSQRDLRPDLIISDHHLGKCGTGIEAIARIRAVYAYSLPAFLVSGDTSPERLKQARAEGFFLLYKPVSPMRLRVVLSEVFGCRDGASAAPAAAVRTGGATKLHDGWRNDAG
jgi:signal transduction histidine kinase/CheY-like chemotaxis protein